MRSEILTATVLLAGLLLSPLGRADESASAPAAEPTDVAALSASDAVVVGTARVLRPGVSGTPTILRLVVARTLKGQVDGEATIFLANDSAASARGPSVLAALEAAAAKARL